MNVLNSDTVSGDWQQLSSLAGSVMSRLNKRRASSLEANSEDVLRTERADELEADDQLPTGTSAHDYKYQLDLFDR